MRCSCSCACGPRGGIFRDMHDQALCPGFDREVLWLLLSYIIRL